MSVCGYVCKWVQVSWKPEESIGFPGSGVTGICEPPDVLTGNQTEVFCKYNESSKYWTISLQPVFFFFNAFVSLWSKVRTTRVLKSSPSCSIFWESFSFIEFFYYSVPKYLGYVTIKAIWTCAFICLRVLNYR